MKITSELIEKYYANQCSSAERRVVEEWLLANTTPVESSAIEEIKQRLASELDLHTHSRKPLYFRLKPWIWSAAAVLIMVTLTITYQLNQTPVPEASQQYITAIGEQKKLVLDDGSIVTLNAGSTLTIDTDFGGHDRRVYLKGEALFEVAKNPKKPFFVTGDYTTVEVLGTVFNFKSYLKNRFELTVLEGKVKVTDTAGVSHILLANDEIQWASGAFHTKHSVDGIDKVVWQENILVFDDTPMLDVVETLERHYGHKIAMDDQMIMTQTLTARFEKMDLHTVLETIAFSLKLDYRIDEHKKITLYVKGQ